MTPFDHLVVQPEDELHQRFKVAILREPGSERELHRQIWSVSRDMKKQIERIRTDVRDCNVILARTIDKALRFGATGMPADA